MLTDNLYRQVLIEPAVSEGCDQLCILSGYASSAMMYRHLQGNPLDKVTPSDILPQSVNVKLILGMCSSDGVPSADHQEFLALSEKHQRITIKYRTLLPPIHSKVYVWLKKGRPKTAFLGSANYSQGAFQTRTLEAMSAVDPQVALQYFESHWASSTPIGSALVRPKGISNAQNKKQIAIIQPHRSADLKCELPLTKYGRGIETHRSAGLNWSFRRNSTRHNPNQAYIDIPSTIARTDFFPPRDRYFLIETDDHELLMAVTAQPKVKDASISTFHAIETPEDNSILGKYFRKRIGKFLKIDLMGKPIKIEDLKRYGRLTVTFTKTSDETYYMDFSPK